MICFQLPDNRFKIRGGSTPPQKWVNQIDRDIRNITSHLTEAKNGFSDTDPKSVASYFVEDTYKGGSSPPYWAGRRFALSDSNYRA